MLLAANLGDDADMVAFVTGQLAEALWGEQAIPPVWLEQPWWNDLIRDRALALANLP